MSRILRFSPLLYLILAAAWTKADNHSEPLDQQTLAVIASKGGLIELSTESGSARMLSRFDTFIPQKQVLRTHSDSFASIVLSNGLALYLAPDTEVTIESMRADAVPNGYFKRELEPAYSEVHLRLNQGTLAISHPNRRASSLIYLDVDATSLLLIGEAFVAHQTIDELTLDTLQGTAYLIGTDGQRKDFVQAGQALTASASQPGHTTSSRLLPAQLRKSQALLQLADVAANNILFQFPTSAQPGPIQAVTVRQASHFRKKPVDDYYLGGRSF